MPGTQLEELTALRIPPSWIGGKEMKKENGQEEKQREGREQEKGGVGNITHCSIANNKCDTNSYSQKQKLASK